MEFDNYASHLLVLEKMCDAFPIKRVLEFGVGSYSTPFFARRCQAVTSVEQESREWYERMKAQIKFPNWHCIFEPDPRVVFRHLDADDPKPDMVFSDGAARTRCLVANLALERNVHFVVFHDAEKIWYYRWNLLNIPDNYSRFNFCHRKGVSKVTTILANTHHSDLEHWQIPEHDRILQVYSSPRQPTYQLLWSEVEHHLACKDGAP